MRFVVLKIMELEHVNWIELGLLGAGIGVLLIITIVGVFLWELAFGGIRFYPAPQRNLWTASD
jgi:hypothetical protein